MTADNHTVWSEVAWVSVTSPTNKDFLQGYLTCDTARLSDDSLIPMAICNIQGRVVASGWALGASAELTLLLVHTTLKDRVVEFLTPYARFARVQVEPEQQPVHLGSSGAKIYDRFVTLPNSQASLPDSSTDVSETLRRAMVEDQFALVSAAVSEKYLPQMLNLHERAAVDFDKGCYLGQEVVARAQFRGAVKRTLVQFSWQGDRPEPGSKNTDGHIVICIASSPEDAQSGIGLAVA